MKIVITPESVISSLFLNGYRQIHPVFYSVLISKILLLDLDIEYEEKELSETFRFCTILDEDGYHFKQGFNMNTNVSKICNIDTPYYSFKEFLSTMENKIIIEKVLSQIDLFFVSHEAYDLLPNQVKQKRLIIKDMLK